MDSLNAGSQSTAIDTAVGESSEQGTMMPELISSELGSRVYNAGTCGCSISADDSDSKRVEEALDKILGAQNRLEQVRLNLEQVDRIGLSCRTVAGLIEAVTRHLEHSLDLLAVRILLAEGQEIADVFRRSAAYGGGTISSDLCPCGGESPLFLGCQDYDFLRMFFGEETENIGSGVVVLLTGDHPLGVLCLASGDPLRYSTVKSTMLIQGLADKICLALMNALDHENAARAPLLSEVEGVYSESFFQEYLLKEFNRSWRTRKPFTLMALNMSNGQAAGLKSGELMDLLRRNLRSTDLIAKGESVGLWALLPETGATEAQKIAERLLSLTEEAFPEAMINIGMTEFSRSATAMAVLLKRAKEALDEAIQNKLRIVINVEGE